METPGVILREKVELDGATVTATLNQTGVLRWTGARNGSLVLQDDLLGYTKGNSTITLHSLKLAAKGCIGRSVGRVRKDIHLRIRTPDSYHVWCEALQRCLDDTGRPKRLLILLNPFGGKSSAKKIFRGQVEPLLVAAGVGYTVKETQFHRHAKDLAKSMDLSQYDGIVCVSGDGVLVEVLNGLLEREDWAQAIKMPLGVIPAGTGNGMAKSLLDGANEPCDAVGATFAIIRGCRQALDVATVVQGRARFHSVLLLTWGLIADVDIESERFRCLGSLRVDFYSLIRILSVRHYNGSFAYVPAPGYEESGQSLHGEMEMQSLSADNHNIDTDGERSWRKTGYMGPMLVPERSEWIFVQGDFILVWLQNVPWASEDVMSAPAAMFADGFLDLIVIKSCPWWILLTLLLRLKDGGHVKSKYVKYLKVKAFRLAPGGRVGSRVQGGIIDLDGEVMARGHGAYGDGSSDPMLYGPPIQVTVEKGLATVFCPPPLGD